MCIAASVIILLDGKCRGQRGKPQSALCLVFFSVTVAYAKRRCNPNLNRSETERAEWEEIVGEKGEIEMWKIQCSVFTFFHPANSPLNQHKSPWKSQRTTRKYTEKNRFLFFFFQETSSWVGKLSKLCIINGFAVCSQIYQEGHTAYLYFAWCYLPWLMQIHTSVVQHTLLCASALLQLALASWTEFLFNSKPASIILSKVSQFNILLSFFFYLVWLVKTTIKRLVSVKSQCYDV